MFTAFVLEADIPALLRQGAKEALGGLSDFLRGSLKLHRQWVQIPLRVNRAGHYILGVVDCREDSSRRVSKCPEASASFLHLVRKFPDFSDGCLHLLYAPDGLYRLERRPHLRPARQVPWGAQGMEA